MDFEMTKMFLKKLSRFIMTSSSEIKLCLASETSPKIAASHKDILQRPLRDNCSITWWPFTGTLIHEICGQAESTRAHRRGSQADDHPL